MGQGLRFWRVENYQHAKNLYEQAGVKHKERVNQIKEVIQKYRLALESENISQMKNLRTDFTQLDENRWSQFFKAVNNLQVEISIGKISFQQRDANTQLDIKFNYSGADMSGNGNKWEMYFFKAASGWRISRISEG